MEKPVKGSSFTSCEGTVKKFIEQSLPFLINKNLNTKISKNFQVQNFSAAASSEHLHKLFLTACIQSLSARKKKSKDVYFSLLYITFVSSRSKPVSEGYGNCESSNCLSFKTNFIRNSLLAARYLILTKSKRKPYFYQKLDKSSRVGENGRTKRWNLS